ncbi:alpha/beta-hydrolase [Gigaspora margarita]|uniref:Alpha/beta-hydrolase n=1 Tax=Gigaspora margarita TaxID=4874 RepID=A0A8H4EIN9_GIGMA|nr:alpha/beta-hydrolase [Gigaspora margarita]
MPPETFIYDSQEQSEFSNKNSYLVSNTNDANLNEEKIPIPVVFVEGFLGAGKPSYWGTLQSIFSNPSDNRNNNANEDKNGWKPCHKIRPCIFVTPGCGSSLHDRAVEIFYQIKGGRVDYGEEHARQYGHSRYGREYSGLYTEWSVSKPLHFLGHSLGGVTIWKLQQLLASDFFPSQFEPHPDMVRSLTSVSAPFKGSQGVYILGSCTENLGSVRPFSFGAWLSRFVHIYEFLDIKWIKNLTYDFNCDHWNFSFTKNLKSMWDEYMGNKNISHDLNYQKLKEEKTYGLLQCLIKSPWMYCKDNAPYDMTIHAMNDLNKNSRTFKNTFYRAYVTSITSQDPITKFHRPQFSFTLPLPIYLLSYQIGSFKFSSKTKEFPIDPEKELPNWYENDGICPKISQMHPGGFECNDGMCKHHKGFPNLITNIRDHKRPNEGFENIVEVDDEIIKDNLKYEPGIWDVWEINGISHFGLIPVWHGTKDQELFFKGYKEYLDCLDKLDINKKFS